MPIVVLDNVITAGQAMNAAPVQGNFEKLRDAINGNNFLQLLTVADRKVAFGQAAAFTWGFGATVDTTTVTITHGLGATPVCVLAGGAIPDPGNSRSPLVTSAHSPTATTFQITMATRDNTTIGPFLLNPGQLPYWLAIA